MVKPLDDDYSYQSPQSEIERILKLEQIYSVEIAVTESGIYNSSSHQDYIGTHYIQVNAANKQQAERRALIEFNKKAPPTLQDNCSIDVRRIV